MERDTLVMGGCRGHVTHQDYEDHAAEGDISTFGAAFCRLELLTEVVTELGSFPYPRASKGILE